MYTKERNLIFLNRRIFFVTITKYLNCKTPILRGKTSPFNKILLFGANYFISIFYFEKRSLKTKYISTLAPQGQSKWVANFCLQRHFWRVHGRKQQHIYSKKVGVKVKVFKIKGKADFCLCTLI